MAPPFSQIKLIDTAAAAILLTIFSVIPIALRMTNHTNNTDGDGKPGIVLNERFPATKAEAAYTIVVASSWILYLPAAMSLFILWCHGKTTAIPVVSAANNFITNVVQQPSSEPDSNRSKLVKTLGVSGLTVALAAILAILIASFCLLTAIIIAMADRAIRSTFEWVLLVDFISIALLVWILTILTGLLSNVSYLRFTAIQACSQNASSDDSADSADSASTLSNDMKRLEIFTQTHTANHVGCNAALAVSRTNQSSSSIRSPGYEDVQPCISYGLPDSQDSLSE